MLFGFVVFDIFSNSLVSVFPPLAIDFWFLARIQVFFFFGFKKKETSF